MLLVLPLFLSISLAAAQSSISSQDATAFALTYGYPLLAFEKVRIEVDAVGVNKWLHFRTLQTPADKAVVKPNVDTLYSSMVYDLSHDDLLISLPDDIPPEQFHLISFFDPFGTNFVNIGTLNTNGTGIYRLQPRTVGPTPEIVNVPDTQLRGTLKTESMYGFILIRWLVNNTNLDAVHTWQDQTLNTTNPVSSRAPALSSLPTANPSATPAENVINLLTAFSRYTLPDDPVLAENITQTLAIAGISNGTYTQPQGVDITAANQTAVAEAAASAADPSVKVTLNNGWTVTNASLIGSYGDDFAFRAAVASSGYLAIVAPNAIYPSWSNGTSAMPLGGDFVLGPSDAYILRFSSQPPLESTGFWSVTAYQDSYLIPNNYSVYAITSERSNITYLDSSNTSFEILIQPGDVAPPANWTSNFLPGPAGGGSMQLTLRLYDAQQSLLSGDWQYPEVIKTIAIVSNTSTPTVSSTTSSTTSGPTSSTTSSTTSGSTSNTTPTSTPSVTSGADKLRTGTGIWSTLLAAMAMIVIA